MEAGHKLVVGRRGEGGAEAELSEPSLRPPFVDLLSGAGIASAEELHLALAEGMATGERLGEVVLRRGWIDEDGLARLLARQWSLPFFEGDALELDPRAAEVFSVADARRLMACPVAMEQERLIVALADPSDERLAAVRSLVDREVSFVVTTPTTLEQTLAALAVSEDLVYDGEEDPAQAAASDEKLDLLLGELDASTERLHGLRAEVARLAETRRSDRHELTRHQERLAALEAERDQGRLTIERLEGELAQRDELLAVVRTKLVDVTGTLEQG
jgi:MshEN domain